MITEHKYLSLYPINPDSKKLIIGTIHPHNHKAFKVPFFYGNEGSLWSILSRAFPNDLKNPVSLSDILSFLNKRKISVSDTVVKCKRLNPTALDKDLIPLELNKSLIQAIKASKIEEILFTSGFSKNNAFRLFYVDILNQKITKDIRKNRFIILDKKFFGREIRLTVLYSPSGSSNVGISKSALYKSRMAMYAKSTTPVKDFKIDYYREMFS